MVCGILVGNYRFQGLTIACCGLKLLRVFSLICSFRITIIHKFNENLEMN